MNPIGDNPSRNNPSIDNPGINNPSKNQPASTEQIEMPQPPPSIASPMFPNEIPMR